MCPVQFEEVSAVIDRSHTLVTEGVVAGVKDVPLTALYIAATEIVEKTDLPRLVQLIREGLDERAVEGKVDLIHEVALFVLLHLASKQNGSAAR